MKARQIAILIALTHGLLVLPLRAQSDPPSHDISQVDPAPMNGAIAIPIPEEEQAKKFEIPELAGAEPVSGSVLVNGHLPHPAFDYLVQTKGHLQRMTVFANGLVTVHITGDGPTLRKRMMLPPDALATYREAISVVELSRIDDQPMDANISENKGYIRAYDDSGTPVTRNFDPSSVAGMRLQEKKTILEDLLRAIAQDREVTNSMVGYMPQVGDLIVGEDQKVWRVTGVRGNGVELTCESEPVKAYYEIAELPRHFIGKKATDR